MTMTMIEVRCCCDAHLIGWAPLPPGCAATLGQTYVYVLGDVLPFEPPRRDVERETLHFQCDVMSNPYEGEPWLALKSRDYPLAQLRRIRGFIAAGDSSETLP